MGNMQSMMKQLQKMQKEMTQAQEKLHKIEFIGHATNDLVQTTFSGDKQMQAIQINKEIIDPEDLEMLQDLVIMAVNDALKQIEKETEKIMGKYSKKGLPGF